MDARTPRAACLLVCLLALGANYRTQNFIISAPTSRLAKEIGEAAERYRKDLANEWLGAELPRWSQPCPVKANVRPDAPAGGRTSFFFRGNRPYGWDMEIDGSRERILDSVLPHEVTHTIFATHFGRPLPRWADEGACTTVEHRSEKAKHDRLLIRFLKSQPPRSIAFNKMFRMLEYPPDILPLYSQGYSVARFLIQQQGKRTFIRFMEEGLRTDDWQLAVDRHYGYKNLSSLQLTWIDWVRQGSPEIDGEYPVIAWSPNGTDTGQRQPERAPASSSSGPVRPVSTAAGDGWYSRRHREVREQGPNRVGRAAAESESRRQASLVDPADAPRHQGPIRWDRATQSTLRR